MRLVIGGWLADDCGPSVMLRKVYVLSQSATSLLQAFFNTLSVWHEHADKIYSQRAWIPSGDGCKYRRWHAYIALERLSTSDSSRSLVALNTSVYPLRYRAQVQRKHVLNHTSFSLRCGKSQSCWEDFVNVPLWDTLGWRITVWERVISQIGSGKNVCPFFKLGSMHIHNGYFCTRLTYTPIFGSKISIRTFSQLAEVNASTGDRVQERYKDKTTQRQRARGVPSTKTSLQQIPPSIIKDHETLNHQPFPRRFSIKLHSSLSCLYCSY